MPTLQELEKEYSVLSVRQVKQPYPARQERIEKLKHIIKMKKIIERSKNKQLTLGATE